MTTQILNNSFHSEPVEKVLKKLSSKIDGLSYEEAKNRLQDFGPNEIPEKKAKHPVLIFLKQFHSILMTSWSTLYLCLWALPVTVGVVCI